MIVKNRSIHALTMIAAGLAAVFPAYAEEDEIAELTRPVSTIEAGVGWVSDDNLRFGQYTGLTERGVYGLLGVDVVNRHDPSGTWLRLNGRHLGLDHRSARFEHERQGNWRYFIDFSQTPRFNPYIVNSANAGLGTPTQVIGGLPAPVDVRLRTRRDAVTAGFGKQLGGGFDVQVRYRHEEKDGGRLFGQGTNNIINFLAEPINQTTRQLDAVASYTGERLQLSGGYYGTGFDNHNTRLDVVGGIAGQTPIALPPDNESHQVHLSGGYSITPTTRAMFRAAYGRITQNDTFIGPSAPGRTDLGGRIDVRQLQLGVTSRPLPRLSVLANVRQEDRDDKTPLAQYWTGIAATSTLDGFNEPRSIKTTGGKLEANYGLPANFRVGAGVEYEERERNTYRVRSVSHRDKTEETSYRVELRRAISSVTGALSYVHSERDGTPFLTTVTFNNAVGSNLIAPIHLADRDRDRIGLNLHWAATEALSLQFMGYTARDSYETRTAAGLGPRRGEAHFYSLDASLLLTEGWQATAWVSTDDNRMDQATRTGTTDWAANLRNKGMAAGAGFTGRAGAQLDFGADVSVSRIRDSFGVHTIVGPTQPPELIPDITTRTTTIRLFTRYALQKNSGLRLQYIYDRWQSDEWTWSAWVYSDGTRVLHDPKQEVHFVGLSYYYRFQ